MKIDDDGRLRCPTCDFDYVHIESVTMLARPDGEDGRLAAITVDSAGNISDGGPGATDGRRHAVVLTGTCEDGHKFNIELRQHKGQTEVHG